MTRIDIFALDLRDRIASEVRGTSNTRLHLGNFQAIPDFTTLHLSPITMLVGPNSAGKSAVRDAMQLLEALVNEGAEITNSQTNAIDALCKRWSHRTRGGRNTGQLIVGYGHHLDNLYAVDDGQKVLFPWQMDLAGWASRRGLSDFEFRNFPLVKWLDEGRPFDVDVLIELDGKRARSLTRLGMWVDGLPFYRWSGPGKYAEFCLDHPYFGEDVGARELLNSQIVRRDRRHGEEEYIGARIGLDRPRIALDRLSTGGASLARIADPWDLRFLGARIGHGNPSSAYLLDFLSFAIPLYVWEQQKFAFVGPLRELPSAGELKFEFSSADYVPSSFYYEQPTEESAWRFLALAFAVPDKEEFDPLLVHFWPPDALKLVNRWLSSDEFLGTGLTIQGLVERLVPDSELRRRTKARNATEKYKTLVTLRLTRTDSMDVEVEDVGVGLSQVIPVLVAIATAGAAYVEQPELHLHPRLQTKLADVLVSRVRSRGGIFILESHSEHLILRLLRRIRESSSFQFPSRETLAESELVESTTKRRGRETKANIENLSSSQELTLDSSEVSFYYFQPTKNGTKVTRIRASKDGDFLDGWPEGFFEERLGELFDE